MSAKRSKLKGIGRQWDYRYQMENDTCTPEAWKEALEFLGRLKPEQIAQFRLIVYRRGVKP